MPHPRTQDEILAALESNAALIAAFFSGQPDPVLFTGDPEHWGPAHHLIHLTRASGAIKRGLRSPALPVHAAGVSRSYAEVLEIAATSLVTTPKEQLLEMGRVVVLPTDASGSVLVEDYVRASAALRAAAVVWNEEDLDRCAMKHPLIGMLSVREMLLFCVFHERHHLKQVQKRVSADSA